MTAGGTKYAGMFWRKTRGSKPIEIMETDRIYVLFRPFVDSFGKHLSSSDSLLIGDFIVNDVALMFFRG